MTIENADCKRACFGSSCQNWPVVTNPFVTTGQFCSPAHWLTSSLALQFACSPDHWLTRPLALKLISFPAHRLTCSLSAQIIEVSGSQANCLSSSLAVQLIGFPAHCLTSSLYTIGTNGGDFVWAFVSEMRLCPFDLNLNRFEFGRISKKPDWVELERSVWILSALGLLDVFLVQANQFFTAQALQWSAALARHLFPQAASSIACGTPRPAALVGQVSSRAASMK